MAAMLVAEETPLELICVLSGQKIQRVVILILQLSSGLSCKRSLQDSSDRCWSDQDIENASILQ
jgi:hypothetical protein